jgi:hypothetical protein
MAQQAARKVKAEEAVRAKKEAAESEKGSDEKEGVGK